LLALLSYLSLPLTPNYQIILPWQANFGKIHVVTEVWRGLTLAYLSRSSTMDITGIHDYILIKLKIRSHDEGID